MEKTSFSELNLTEQISKAIEDMGFEEASPIQSQAIPLMKQGLDIIGQSQTGTGKTAAFGIPILEMINQDSNTLQAIILSPTRELAIQISEEMRRLAKYMPNVKCVAVYGGQPIDRQIKALRNGVQIVIGTPGRIMDHMRRKTINFENVKLAVLDEADEMLDMGFRDDMETILTEMPKNIQTVMFSATMARPILDLTERYLKKPKLVKVVHKELTVPNIEQYYYEVRPKDRAEVLSRLMDMHNPKLAVVFCNTKRGVDDLVSQLQARGYLVDGLHGDMKQIQRDRVMNKFRNGTVEILVATDVAARGIDVDDVEAVFNYDIPQDEEYYVHRIGRTGRAGRKGMALTFVSGREIYKLKDIERYAKTKVKRQEVPSVSDVEEIKTTLFMEKVKAVLEEGHLGEQVKYIEKFLEDDYTSIDVAAALLKMVMGEANKETTELKNEEKVDFGNTGAEPGMVRLFINAGRKDNIKPGDIVGAIAGETSLSGNLIGVIDLYDNYTFVEVPTEYAKEVIMIMKDNKVKGKKINIEPANSK